MTPERPNVAESVRRLKGAIESLTQQQTEMLKTATFAGMTADESKKCDERRKLILNLVCELALLESV